MYIAIFIIHFFVKIESKRSLTGKFLAETGCSTNVHNAEAEQHS